MNMDKKTTFHAKIDRILFFLCPVLLLAVSPCVRACTLKQIQRNLPGAGVAYFANIALVVLPLLAFTYVLFADRGNWSKPLLISSLSETLLLMILPLVVKRGPLYNALMKTGAIELHMELGCILLGMLALLAWLKHREE